jgi:2-polyprenyl-3-methyl-5-hydroxy-6-metoxy-1,4-benzoquinol methylase
MKKVSTLFNSRSKKYNAIYSKTHSKKLLHQEKKVRAETVENLVIHYLSTNNEDVVVDVGCGMGNVLLNLRKRGLRGKMYGADVSHDMIRLANNNLKQSEHKDINFITGSIEDISVRANMVLSLGVLGYQQEQEKFLDNLSNLVDRKGYLIFTTANGDSFLRLSRQYLSKLHSFIKGKTKSKGVEFFSIRNKKVDSLLIKNGFKVEKKVYMTFGLGLVASSIECSMDRWFFKYFSNNSFIGKYFSLSVIYVYKRVD